MVFFRQAWKVARFDLITALRTKRAVAAVILYFLGALGTAHVLVVAEIELSERFPMGKAVVDASLASGRENEIVDALSWFLNGDKEMARHLLGIPLVVAGFFWLTLTFLPFLVALVSHDLVNAEIRNRSARFTLLRCTRSHLLAGKMISHTLLFLAVTVLSNIVLCAYAAIRLPGFSVWTASGWLLKFWAFTLVFGYCYLSLTALISSLVDSGGLALALLFLVLIAFGILSISDTVGFLSPSAYKLGLWSPRIAEVAGSLGVFALFGTVFLALAWLRFSRRDL